MEDKVVPKAGGFVAAEGPGITKGLEDRVGQVNLSLNTIIFADGTTIVLVTRRVGPSMAISYKHNIYRENE